MNFIAKISQMLCREEVSFSRHINPDGSMGAQIPNDVTVEDNVIIEKGAIIWPGSVVKKGSRIKAGELFTASGNIVSLNN